MWNWSVNLFFYLCEYSSGWNFGLSGVNLEFLRRFHSIDVVGTPYYFSEVSWVEFLIKYIHCARSTVGIISVFVFFERGREILFHVLKYSPYGTIDTKMFDLRKCSHSFRSIADSFRSIADSFRSSRRMHSSIHIAFELNRLSDQSNSVVWTAPMNCYDLKYNMAYMYFYIKFVTVEFIFSFYIWAFR